MTALTTFYLSQILGVKIFTRDNDAIGKVRDILVYSEQSLNGEPARPTVVAVKTGSRSHPVYYNFSTFEINRHKDKIVIICSKKQYIGDDELAGLLPLKERILDQQIVDLNGRKLVRVNDVRLASIPSGTYVVAVDVGVEGLLRRLGVAETVKRVASVVKLPVPAKFILWDDVDTLDTSNLNIRLGKPLTKLQMLHPSDLADIIEELGRSNRNSVFSSLDEEQAADVLEEMDPKLQVDLIESLPVSKAADVLEKMPADEAADIIDLLEREKAEMLLNEMDKETSGEVRELLEYSNRSVGSIMSTDFISFHENETVEQALATIRESKPEEPMLYNLFIVTHSGKLLATVSLRNLVVSEPDVILRDIMHKNPVSVEDNDKLDSLAEIVSKYNLLAVPVVNQYQMLEGMVVIDDIVDDLLGARKTR
ncbi:MAG: magnesium transporter MgtE N-terminal domain-containing protein [Bacteroidales bacterium]